MISLVEMGYYERGLRDLPAMREQRFHLDRKQTSVFVLQVALFSTEDGERRGASGVRNRHQR